MLEVDTEEDRAEVAREAAREGTDGAQTVLRDVLHNIGSTDELYLDLRCDPCCPESEQCTRFGQLGGVVMSAPGPEAVPCRSVCCSRVGNGGAFRCAI